MRHGRLEGLWAGEVSSARPLRDLAAPVLFPSASDGGPEPYDVAEGVGVD
jgi:hypothetical protein